MIELSGSLPARAEAGLTLEDQARRVLYLLCDFTGEPSQSPKADFHKCPHCGAPADSLSSPYCSAACRDQAAFVRQFRAAIASGLILTAEKQTVFGERLWWLLGGGLPMRESRIPESAKRQVVRRSEGKCEFCGSVMSGIENFGSGCNRPLHLRAVCDSCSKTKAFGDAAFIQSEAVTHILSDLAPRVSAAAPVRLCDDPEKWDWRAFIARRRSGSATSP